MTICLPNIQSGGLAVGRHSRMEFATGKTGHLAVCAG
jgi:hypothetical protein